MGSQVEGETPVYARTLRKETSAVAPSPHAVALEDARAEVLAAGEAFRRSAAPATSAALRSRLEDLIAAERDWYEGMSEDVRAAFGDATERAIAQAVTQVETRLTDDVWLDPLVAPGIDRRPASGWDASLPEWMIGILRVFTPRDRADRLGELDDLGNRAWVAVLAAAEPLDPVLEEFGLVPSDVPDLGGGNFGLAPRTARELDPTGALGSLWQRYREAYERYRTIAGDEGRRSRPHGR